MLSELENRADRRVCLVTGGTSGIGRATVELFRRGGFLIATCGRESKRLDALRVELQAESTQHFVERVDLADVGQTQSFAQAVRERFGRVDVLVNNAAFAPLKPFEELDLAALDRLIEVNIRSPFVLTQDVWQTMRRQELGGQIVNISSLAAVDPFPGFSIYGASKAWIDLMTRALAAEGKTCGIRVVSIRAGAVETPMLRGLFPDFPTEQCVSPEEVARMVWEAVHDPNRFPSGEHFVITNQT